MTRLGLIFALMIWIAEATAAAPITPPEWLKTALSEQIRKEIGGEVQVRVQTVHLVSPSKLARGEVRLVGGIPASGLAQFELLGKSESTRGSVSYEAWGSLILAKRAIRIGEPFTEENTRTAPRLLNPFAASGFYLSLGSLAGRRARNYVPIGAVVTAQQTEVPAEVRYGAKVDLIYRSPGLSVSAAVKALDNGRRDDWIRVQNLSTSKVFQARVTGPGTVEIP